MSADDKQARFKEATGDSQVADDSTFSARLMDSGEHVGSVVVGYGSEWRFLTTDKGTKLYQREGSGPYYHLELVKAVSPMPPMA